jgi:hypothetical protein
MAWSPNDPSVVPPYYRMPSGKLPSQDGKLVLISREQFYECCCGCDKCTTEGKVLVDTGLCGLGSPLSCQMSGGFFICNDVWFDDYGAGELEKHWVCVDDVP